MEDKAFLLDVMRKNVRPNGVLQVRAPANTIKV